MTVPRKKRVFLLIESSNGYGWEFLRGVTSYVRAHHDWVIDFEDHRVFDPIPAHLKEERWDGVIFRSIASPSDYVLHNEMAYPCPTVELHGDDRRTEVRGDAVKILELAVDHFSKAGFSEIAFFANFNLIWAEDRRNILRQICQARGMGLHFSPDIESPIMTAPSHERNKGSERSLHQWLKKLPKPIGVVGVYDYLGVRVVAACKKLGIQVPGEIAVLGIGNDVRLCEALTPSLSSIDIFSFQIGYESARLLDLKMNNRPLPPLPILIPPSGLVIRESSRTIGTENADILEAIQMIGDNVIYGLTVSDILTHLQISSRTLERGIKAAIGRSPKAEIIRVRLAHAVELLEKSDHSVAEIAHQSGFASRSSFVSIFQKIHGKTPHQHRVEKRKP